MTHTVIACVMCLLIVWLTGSGWHQRWSQYPPQRPALLCCRSTRIRSPIRMRGNRREVVELGSPAPENLPLGRPTKITTKRKRREDERRNSSKVKPMRWTSICLSVCLSLSLSLYPSPFPHPPSLQGCELREGLQGGLALSTGKPFLSKSTDTLQWKLHKSPIPKQLE